MFNGDESLVNNIKKDRKKREKKILIFLLQIYILIQLL